MRYYGNAQVCLNGHMVTPSIELNPNSKENFCSECGSKTITKCPKCEALIRGGYYDDQIPNEFYAISEPGLAPDAYCHNCGSPYPWTEAVLKSPALLIQEEAELDEQSKNSLVESLPDIIAENPGTNLATVRIKKALSSAGTFTADALRQFVIDFGCEFVIRKLNL
ncbi:MAG TPA: DUF2321 domain-containing protein [Clostridium sp.]|nr:DUF2321 domain-containing protein [Clostridium sp.]